MAVRPQGTVGPDRVERTVTSAGKVIQRFQLLIARIPEDRTLVVLLNNTGGVPLALIAGHGDILYGREPQPPRRSVARVSGDHS
jgi:hypothetical protein